jgi:predicted Zn-dependent protease
MPQPAHQVQRSARKQWTVIAGTLTFLAIGGIGLWLKSDTLTQQARQDVRRAIASRQFDKASYSLEKWLSSSPASAEAHFLKAEVAWAQNDLLAATTELGRAHDLGFDQQALDRLRGLILARGNKPAEAEPVLRRTLDQSRAPDPDVAEALVRIYLGSFRLGEAASLLDRWMSAYPDDARPFLLRTEIDIRTSATPGVLIERYQNALSRDPGLDQARLGLAAALRRDRRHAEAATEYARYLARKPNDPLGYVGAGENALELGDQVAAGRWIDRALSLAPHDSEALAARAALELQAGRLAAALEFFDQAIRADPFDHWNRYQRMLILSRLGKKSEANAERIVVERLKNEERRFDQVSRELMRNPLDSGLRSEAAEWLMKHGHQDEAVAWANLVLGHEPAHPAMNRLLADYYRAQGQIGLANFHEARASRPSDQAPNR